MAVLLVLAATLAQAQEVTASVSGLVSDGSGGAVVGATVVAKDLDRGSVFPTTTNGEGFYSLPRLPIGTYSVSVEGKGFKSVIRNDVHLSLNQAARLDFQLQVGDVQQTINVTEAAPLLQTEDAQLGTIINSKTNTQLPLATRNYVQLTLLAPGAVTTNPKGFTGPQATFNGSRPFINGNREQTNNFMLDGLDNNQISDNLIAYAPNVDAIEEFNQITQNASAEFGNFMGGITSVSTKSGTNSYHGSAFEFFRNDKLNANQWDKNFQGAPRDKLRDNLFGATFGGPAIKNKLFFFTDYQGTRWNNPSNTNYTSVLTAAERNGNFSALGKTLYDPTSSNSSKTRTPFANAVLPASLISPIAKAIVNSKYYPSPTNSLLQNNYGFSESSHTYMDQGDVRGDWNISDKDKFFVRFSRESVDNPSVNTMPLRYNGTSTANVYNGAMDYTRTFGSSFVNDLRLGVNYTLNYSGQTAGSLGNLAKEFGIAGVPDDILPSMEFGNAYASNFGNRDGVQSFNNTVIQWTDTGIWTKGHHTVKFGFQQYRIRINTFYSGNNGKAGYFNFNGQYSGHVTNDNVLIPGLGEADYMMGLPGEVGVGSSNGGWGQRGNIFASFVQDTWRIRKDLTLNYGLRWELHTPWTEVHNRMTNYNLTTGAIAIAGGQNCNMYGNCNALYNQYNGAFNFQPRVGIAYNPGSGKTVYRGSFTTSEFLEGTGTNLRLTANPPFGLEKVGRYNDSLLAMPGSTLDQGYTPIGSASDPYKGVNLRVWDPNFRPAVSLQWNFSVQRQLTNSTTLQVAYVGQKNNHLVVAMPYMQKRLNADGTTSPSPFLAGNPTLLASISQISGTAARGNQSYKAMQAVLQQRLLKGLTGQVAWTWSRCMTDSTGFYGAGGGQSAAQSPYVQNIYDQKAEWGKCGWDIEHVVSGYLNYDLPFGKGRTFANNLNKAADAVIGGWQINSIVQVHGGFPLAMTTWSDASGTGARSNRLNCASSISMWGKRQDATLQGYRWFDPKQFSEPAQGTFGNCPVGVGEGPGLTTVDMNLSKKFAITETQSLEFRSEFINALNHPILNAPNTWSGDSMGMVQSSQGARNIQFGLKYSF